MKVMTLALVLAVISSGAWADWLRMGENEEDVVFYVDPATIRRNGSLRRVWIIHDLKARDKNGAMSIRLFSEYDCKEERVRILTVTAHAGPMASGSILASAGNGDWEYSAPGTGNAYVLKYLCAR